MEENHNSFFKPQRQSKIGVVLLFLYSLIQVVKSLWVFIFVYIFKKDSINTYLSILIVGVIIFLLASSILRYYNFKYYIDSDNEEFIINEGIINKSVIRIKIKNIQEVSISQPFIHRIFNIYKLEIDTPGSSEKEVKISALSHKNAVDLKQYLLSENHSKIENPIENEEHKDNISKINISVVSLLKYGLTANYVQSFFALLSLLLYAVFQINDLLDKTDYSDRINIDELGSQLISFSIPVMIILFLFVIILGVLINVIRTLIRYFKLSITETLTVFSLEYGLFNTKNSIITKKRVQVIIETQNWFQKKMNVSYLKFLQIGKIDHEKHTAAILGIDTIEKEKIIDSVWHENPKFEHFLKPNFRLLIVNNFQFFIIPIIVGFFYYDYFLEYWFFALIFFVISELFLIKSFMNKRLYYNQRFVRIKLGIWDINHKTFEAEKLQTVKISQYFWQRKNNLGSITMYTSAGRFSFPAVNFFETKKLFNYLLYKIEKSVNKSN